MTEKEKVEYIISPEQFFPPDIRLGNLLGNKNFIEPLVSLIEILRESQFWPQEKLKYIQIERLKKLTAYIAKHSPFWANHFKIHNFSAGSLTSCDALQLLPIFYRKTLAELGSKIYIYGDDIQSIYTQRTSGTGGLSMRIAFDEKELILTYFAYCFRHSAFINVPLMDLFERKFVIMLGLPGDRQYLSRDFVHHVFDTLTTADFEDVVIRHVIYEKIRQASPAMLVGYASLILKLTQCIADDGVKLPIFSVRLSSEPILPSDRLFIEETLEVPVLNILSSNETGLIGFECPENIGKYHLNSERIILEIVDNNGTQLREPNLDGDIVITVLNRTVTPIIRYAIGDTGKLLPGSCNCGRTLPLFEFHGRRENVLKLPSGRTVKSVYIQERLSKAGLFERVKQFQVQQVTPNCLKLLIIPNKFFREEHEGRIRLALTELFGGEKILIDIEHVEDIPTAPGGKSQFFIPLADTTQL